MFEQLDILVVKITKQCNLRCEYCYVKDYDDTDNKFVSLNEFKSTINRIVEDRLSVNNKQTISINILGGEPTLTDRRIFYHMCEYATGMFMRHGIELKLSIQTNLVSVDEDWCKLFSKFNFYVGVSWGSINGANDLRTSENHYDEKIKLLKKYNVAYYFQLMMNSQSVSHYKESASYINNNLGQLFFKANYIEDVKGHNTDIKGCDYFNEVVKTEIDYFINNGKARESNTRQIIKRFLSDYLTNTGIHHAEGGACGVKYCGAGMNIMTLIPGGIIQLCGRSGNALDEATLLGNIGDIDFLSSHRIKKYVDYIKEKSKAIKQLGCDDCIAQSICDHGCMALHRSKTGEWGISSDLVCNIFIPTYQYLLDNVNAIFESIFNNLESGKKYRIEVPVDPSLKNYNIYSSKIQFLMDKHDISLFNDNNILLFKKR